ncbi:hypothetical protein PG985_005676 [Apiospora marii]|uniref:uncharacterized protein n=1 Tax=Apiospora marii TaxID=335849 RepID=UPI0031312728
MSSDIVEYVLCFHVDDLIVVLRTNGSYSHQAADGSLVLQVIVFWGRKGSLAVLEQLFLGEDVEYAHRSTEECTHEPTARAKLGAKGSRWKRRHGNEVKNVWKPVS